MPIASVLRALGKMTADKVLEPGGSDLATVCERIQSEAVLKKVRHTTIFLQRINSPWGYYVLVLLCCEINVLTF